jgi:hypothetical protein
VADQFSFNNMRNRFNPKSQALTTRINTTIKAPVLATDSQQDSNPVINRLVEKLDAIFEEL